VLLAHLQWLAGVGLVGVLRRQGFAVQGQRSSDGSRLRPNRWKAGLSAKSCAGKVRRSIEGVKVPQSKGQSVKATLAPNPSFERTPYSGLRPLPGAAQLERWAPANER
jgi:hypothetical protein